MPYGAECAADFTDERLMKIWLPYIRGGSGTDVFTEILASALSDFGCQPVMNPVNNHWQFFPWGMPYLAAPVGTDITLVNSWNGFMFRRPGIKQVVVEHLCVHDPAMRPYRNFAQAIFHNTAVRHFERKSFVATDAVVAVSEYTARAVKRAFPAVDVQVIHNGIDTNFFCPSNEENKFSENQPFRLLFIGNATPRKGADLLPRVIRKLGPGYELRYTSGLRADDPFKDVPGMIPLGRLAREQVRQELRNADIFFFPTRLEGLPLVVMEAMSCGTPVISSDAASLPEMICDGVNGRLCPVDDLEAMVTAIRSVNDDREMLAQMGRGARQAAVRNFNISRMGESYFRLFESLLSQN